MNENVKKAFKIAINAAVVLPLLATPAALARGGASGTGNCCNGGGSTPQSSSGGSESTTVSSCIIRTKTPGRVPGIAKVQWKDNGSSRYITVIQSLKYGSSFTKVSKTFEKLAKKNREITKQECIEVGLKTGKKHPVLAN